ncbi:TetR/AcrR family transcriptional regulator [Pelagibius litoralis]|uniref:TetR/AcrR family transcriptional regulator n=1 Tax=Pelagibius litoralis TaxID=374515 RepID=A0A967EXA0_9PROT|nr:TetR/AcrR family transcriptional regulator [Pelagibius litoralis]NIA68465.1 TetR/AcrR family transcriptional regulator [Pelagibius litoralis]
MARSREFDDQAAVSAVEDVFWRCGYERTSYADLMKVTGLGKGSLYAAFGNKHALYLRALDTYIAREVAAVALVLTAEEEESPLSGIDRIRMFLDVVIAAVEKRGDRRGCFLCNAAVDMAPHDKGVEAVVKVAMDKMRDALQEALREVLDEEHRKAAAEHLLAVYLGMRVLAKAGTPVPRLRLVRDTALKDLAG